MGLVLEMMLQLLKLCIIGFSVAVQGSKGLVISPSQPLHPRNSWTTIAPSSSEVPNGSYPILDPGSFSHPPNALPFPASAPTPPQKDKDTGPSISPSPSTIALSPPYEVVPSPSRNAPGARPPVSTQTVPATVAISSGRPENNSSVSQPTEHGTLAPSIDNKNATQSHTAEPVSHAAVNLEKPSSVGERTEHGGLPSVVHQRSANTGHNLKPVSSESAASPPVAYPIFPSISPSVLPAPVASALSTRSRSFNSKKGGAPPVAAPLYKTLKPLPAAIHSPPQDQEIPPSLPPASGETHHVPQPKSQGSSVPPFSSPIHSPTTKVPFAPSPSIKISPPPTEMQVPLFPPKVSPSSPKTPLLPQVQALPPPPPNEECLSTVCIEPYANSPPGAPCRCVWPMRVGLRLSVSLYTFFPLVTELASEIAAGVFMKQSQVRVMGANAANEQAEKTVVLIDLVPLGENFDTTTAFFTSDRFWHKRVVLKASNFGDYDVLYVNYPGLPPSPPLPPSTITMIDGGPYSVAGNSGSTIKPLGVDIQKRQKRTGLRKGVITIIAVSVFLAVALCATASLVMFKFRDHVRQQPSSSPRISQPSLTKAPGAAPSMIGGAIGSASTSFRSSIVAYTGSAKTFSASDIEKATDNFHASRILGEGGFGLVYGGILEDGTKMAVKVLKREDHHGDREFLAEVEMLSRLHHRNLVKLIGICAEESLRCLVYELIPNGSVESHLHGFDREISPLDWDARMKIALGAARGLAYLHEDSSPRVIHRDFKSSNILLEDDFTPKVSDFGLARTATDEENRHVSTRVMGTFGYVAPEYAMTGHLLVMSDVYSYGVVLLELLSGRQPIDMSQPPGKENLVSWARPLLASSEGLEAIIDPSLGSDVSFDSVAKVAAIASMCVQPEVSNRPFMGEVVQALKLVCNECNEAKEEARSSSSSQQEGLSVDLDVGIGNVSGQLPDNFQSQQFSATNFGSGLDVERGLSASELFSSSARFGRQESGSFRRHSYSGPLITGRSRRLWQIMRRLSGGTVSEHGTMFKL